MTRLETMLGNSGGMIEPVLTLDAAAEIYPNSQHSGPHVVKSRFKETRSGKTVEGTFYSNRGYPCRANCMVTAQIDLDPSHAVFDAVQQEWVTRYLVVIPPGLAIAEVLDGEYHRTDLSGATSARAAEELALKAICARAVKR